MVRHTLCTRFHDNKTRPIWRYDAEENDLIETEDQRLLQGFVRVDGDPFIERVLIDTDQHLLTEWTVVVESAVESGPVHL